MRAPLLRTLAALTCAAALGTACDSGEGTHPNPGRHYAGTVIAANPTNGISAIATVTASGYDSAYIRFWRDSLPAEKTPAVSFAADSTVTVPVFGFDPSRDYSLEIVLTAAGRPDHAADTLPFASDTLPSWVPAASGPGTSALGGYVLLSLPEGAAIVNDSGRTVWYRSRSGRVLGSWQVQVDGEITWLGATDSTGFYVYDILGTEIGRHSCQGYLTRFHDLLVTASGESWVMCDEVATMDLTAIGGLDSVAVTATLVQHLDASGQAVFQWRALDHFQLTDIDSTLRTGPAVNFTHGNAITLDTDGNLLVSFRSLNEITKINSTTGAVMWRLGGRQNQFTWVNDPLGGFRHQHGLRVVGPNRIQVLDNRDAAPSRLARYTIDPVAMTATLEWAFEDAPTTFASVGGSTQVLPDGGALVSFGPAGRVVEVDSTGARRWELSGISGQYVFRSQRIRTPYDPSRQPFNR